MVISHSRVVEIELALGNDSEPESQCGVVTLSSIPKPQLAASTLTSTFLIGKSELGGS